MIIAIDGPAGAGKSTTARAVAKYFGFAYIDTGAMYRVVALAASEADLEACDGEAVAQLARSLPIALRDNGQSTLIGERDVSGEIRTPEIGALASRIAALAEVRSVMVEAQRRLARNGEAQSGGAVLEGRDIQTVVFPDAQVKIFLSAHAGTRATRRVAQWSEQGQKADVEETQRALIERDERDSGRDIAPLHAAPDAIEIATDELSTAEIVEQIAQIVREKTGAID